MHLNLGSLEGETIELGDDLKSCSKGNFILLMNYIKPKERLERRGVSLAVPPPEKSENVFINLFIYVLFWEEK